MIVVGGLQGPQQRIGRGIAYSRRRLVIPDQGDSQWIAARRGGQFSPARRMMQMRP